MPAHRGLQETLASLVSQALMEHQVRKGPLERLVPLVLRET